MSKWLGDCVKPPPNMSKGLGLLCWPPSFNKQRVRNIVIASFKNHKANNVANCLKTCLTHSLQWMKPLTQQWCFKDWLYGFTVWKAYFECSGKQLDDYEWKNVVKKMAKQWYYDNQRGFVFLLSYISFKGNLKLKWKKLG